MISFSSSIAETLIIGIDEEDGAASSIVPLSDSNIDQELQRLESIIRASIEPTIVGLRMRRIDVDGGSVIAIHVPRSFNPPHRVIIKNSNRYYARNSAGAHELSLEELRMLFGEQRSIEERVKTFVGERFLRIQGNDGAMPIPASKGILVMHLVPITDFGAERRMEIADLRAQAKLLDPIGSSGFSGRVNLDGYCLYRSGEVCHGYTQMFRDGSVEASTASMFSERKGALYFAPKLQPPKLIQALSSYMKALRALEASPPILLQISAMGISGVRMAVHDWDDPAPPYNREVLHLPPTMITDYRDDGNYEPVIAEQMNFLWNAFGFEHCRYFDANGKWINS
jgi:diadenosine tetraphosphate (Ap4A) HIT family hydrolase